MAPDKQLPHNRRIEWISLIYLIFFVLAVMTPSIVPEDMFGVPQQHIEEVLIFLFGLGGLGTFTLYERLMERRTQERDDAIQSAERAMKELVESYRYIGSVNRQIDVLKKHFNETSMELTGKRAYWKDLLASLAANAAACTNAKSVLIRFVELEKLRTDREVYHHLEGKKVIKISNRELRELHEGGNSHQIVQSEGSRVLVVPSDKQDSPIKAYLLMVLAKDHTDTLEVPLVKVFANQAELIYHNLISKGGQENEEPLEAIEKVTSNVSGEVQ